MWRSVALTCGVLLIACTTRSTTGLDSGSPDSGRTLGPGLIDLDAGSANSLTVSGNQIIFADNGRGIYAIDRTSGSLERLYLKSSPYEFPDEIVADSSNVYWTDLATNRLLRLELAVTDAGPVVLATPTSPNGLRLIGDKLYWASNYGEVGWTLTDGGSERRYPVGGTPSELAVDGDAIYYTDMSGPPGPTHSVARVDLQSGAVSVLADHQGSLGRIVVDREFVYWGTDEGPDGGAVARTRKLGGAPREVVAQVPLPVVALAMDEGEILYFGTFPTSSAQLRDAKLYKLTLDGGLTTTIAEDLQYPLDILPLPEAIFWVEQGRRVARLSPKP